MNDFAMRTSDPQTADGARTRSWVSVLFIVVTSVLFVALAVAAHNTPYFGFDVAIARAVQSIRTPWLVGLFTVVGFLGYPPQIYVEIGVILIVLWLVGARAEAAGFFVCKCGGQHGGFGRQDVGGAGTPIA